LAICIVNRHWSWGAATFIPAGQKICASLRQSLIVCRNFFPYRAAYAMSAFDETKSASNALGITSISNIDSVEPSVIASAVVLGSLSLVNLAIAAGRCGVLRKHDTAGHTTGGVRAWMGFSILFHFIWWFAVVWVILVVMGASYWAALLAAGRTMINTVLTRPTTTPPPPPEVCAPACLDLVYLQVRRAWQCWSAIVFASTITMSS
jgi:hypothetical protein